MLHKYVLFYVRIYGFGRPIDFLYSIVNDTAKIQNHRLCTLERQAMVIVNSLKYKLCEV